MSRLDIVDHESGRSSNAGILVSLNRTVAKLEKQNAKLHKELQENRKETVEAKEAVKTATGVCLNHVWVTGAL